MGSCSDLCVSHLSQYITNSHLLIFPSGLWILQEKETVILIFITQLLSKLPLQMADNQKCSLTGLKKLHMYAKIVNVAEIPLNVLLVPKVFLLHSVPALKETTPITLFLTEIY